MHTHCYTCLYKCYKCFYSINRIINIVCIKITKAELELTIEFTVSQNIWLFFSKSKQFFKRTIFCIYYANI